MLGKTARCGHSAVVVAFMLTMSTPAFAQQRVAPPQVGPENGSLVIVGGALRSPEIYQRFLELAGGPDAHIVMIPTAGGAEEYDQYYQGLNRWRENGARNMTVLHTTDRSEADTDEFVAPLKTADAVYFFGGRQWHLVDAYAGTKAEEEIRKVLDRGGVIGGSSAGASIQGSFLIRGDTRTNTIMMGDHQVGFGYLRGVGIDQHVLKRNRQFDMIEVIEAHPELLGIGLDENTAIVVRGDNFQVIGESYAIIYDARTTTGADGKFYFLAPGDRFNLVTREATRAATTLRAIDNVQKKPWGGR
ncbi:MAG: cyanophycinase [Gemmatimonadota bacterium]|nr:cyanophycinase [Gemmatimonadota bacterium]HAC04383.1 cyanophycinase [Gemmatimonadota bacterium]